MSLLEIRDVSRRFGGLQAVEHVSVSVEKGEIFGIIGPNGAGKTTLLNLCGGVYPTSGGHLYLDGEEITGLPSWTVAGKGIARTFQSIQLFNSMSVIENVMAGFHLSRNRGLFSAILNTKRYRLEQVELRRKAKELLNWLGLAEYENARAGSLSYGMQRKVEIARALGANPKLLLLDEPAAGMNPSETQQLADYIRRIRQEGYTSILIEHDIKFICSLCDRVMVLNYGRKIFEGVPEEVRESQAVIEAYFGRGFTARMGGI